MRKRGKRQAMGRIMSECLPVYTIKVDPTEDKLDREHLNRLATSIEEVGLINPILVRKVGTWGDVKLVSGRHRLIAAQMAGYTNISVRYVDCTEQAAHKIARHENEARVVPDLRCKQPKRRARKAKESRA